MATRSKVTGASQCIVGFVLNVITTGNGTGTKNILKWNRALGFEFSIQSSVYVATTVAKVSLFSNWTRSPVSFYSI